MRRQTMHEDGILLGVPHQPLIDLIGAQQVVAIGAVMAAHGNPGVGHHAIRIPDRRLDVAGDGDPGTLAARPIDNVLRRAQFLRAGEVELEGKPLGGVNPGGGHIVAVAAPGDLAPGDGPAMLLEGHHIGHQLAGMRPVGQAVDDRHRRMLGHLDQLLLLRRPQHDDVDIAREHARGIGHGLAAAELRAVALQDERLASHLAHAELEGDPGAGRGLLEDHGERLACQRPRIAVRREVLLEARADLEDLAQLRRRQPVEIEEVARRHAATLGTASATRSRIASPSSISAAVMISGGSRRTTLSPAPTVKSPAARSLAIMSALGMRLLSPSSRPAPRTSSKASGRRLTSLSRPPRNSLAMAWTCSKNPSASITSSTALATAMASGLPPKVLPWLPAVRARAAFSLARQAPTGNPPPSPLAVATMSGSMPAHSWAKSLPVRPMPHWTSSRKSSRPNSSQTARSPLR